MWASVCVRVCVAAIYFRTIYGERVVIAGRIRAAQQTRRVKELSGMLSNLIIPCDSTHSRRCCNQAISKLMLESFIMPADTFGSKRRELCAGSARAHPIDFVRDDERMEDYARLT